MGDRISSLDVKKYIKNEEGYIYVLIPMDEVKPLESYARFREMFLESVMGSDGHRLVICEHALSSVCADQLVRFIRDSAEYSAEKDEEKLSAVGKLPLTCTRLSWRSKSWTENGDLKEVFGLSWFVFNVSHVLEESEEAINTSVNMIKLIKGEATYSQEDSALRRGLGLVNESMLLQPNVFGVGVDLNKVFSRLFPRK